MKNRNKSYQTNMSEKSRNKKSKGLEMPSLKRSHA